MVVSEKVEDVKSGFSCFVQDVEQKVGVAGVVLEIGAHAVVEREMREDKDGFGIFLFDFFVQVSSQSFRRVDDGLFCGVVPHIVGLVDDVNAEFRCAVGTDTVVCAAR